jgi:hypothetical protein
VAFLIGGKVATEREKKAGRICAKLQVRAYKRRWKPKERELWDKMISIIRKERER